MLYKEGMDWNLDMSSALLLCGAPKNKATQSLPTTKQEVSRGCSLNF